MLDVVMKDLMTLGPEKIALSLEEPFSLPTPSKPTTSQPEKAAQPEDFTLVPRRRPLALPYFTLSQVDESRTPNQSRQTGP